jgi:hypothetical protein
MLLRLLLLAVGVGVLTRQAAMVSRGRQGSYGWVGLTVVLPAVLLVLEVRVLGRRPVFTDGGSGFVAVGLWQ